jgi:hypothetical protein
MSLYRLRIQVFHTVSQLWKMDFLLMVLKSVGSISTEL